MSFCKDVLSRCGLHLLSCEPIDFPTLNNVYKCSCCSSEPKEKEEDKMVLVRCPKNKDYHVFWGNGLKKFDNEAKCMQFAAEGFKDLFKVPKVYGHGVQDDLPFLVMEFVDSAQTLRSWMKGKNPHQLDAMATRLLSIVKGMCDHKVPFEHIGSFDEAGLWFDGPNLNPCKTMEQFVKEMIHWSADQVKETDKEVSDMLISFGERLTFAEKARLVFRHGDLSIDNVMVTEEEEIYLIDWEWSGVFDERDVWLEARELMRAMKSEQKWKDFVKDFMDTAKLDLFYDIKQVYMGVAWSLQGREEDREEELDILRENLKSFGC